MERKAGDEVTIKGRWYQIEQIETDGDTFFFLVDENGNGEWFKEDEID